MPSSAVVLRERTVLSVIGRRVLLFGLTVFVACVLGCSLFRSQSLHCIAQDHLCGGASVALNVRVASGYFKTTKVLEVQVDAPGEKPRLYATDVTDRSDENYSLRVDPDNHRVWVVTKESGQVVLSVDTQSHQVWRDPGRQPDWATRD